MKTLIRITFFHQNIHFSEAQDDFGPTRKNYFSSIFILVHWSFFQSIMASNISTYAGTLVHYFLTWVLKYRPNSTYILLILIVHYKVLITWCMDAAQQFSWAKQFTYYQNLRDKYNSVRKLSVGSYPVIQETLSNNSSKLWLAYENRTFCWMGIWWLCHWDYILYRHVYMC